MTQPNDTNPPVMQPGSGLSFPWREHTSSIELGEMNFGENASQAVVVMDIFWLDWFKCLQETMGYPVRIGDGATATLSRKLPHQHRKAPWLYASHVRMQGIGPLGNPSKFYGQFNGNTTGAGIGPTQRYQYMRCTVLYKTKPYRIVSDGDLNRLIAYNGNEFFRWTTVRFVPSGEAITRQQGSFKYAEGPGAGPPPKEFLQGISQQLVKPTFYLKWWDVPEIGLVNIIGIPVNALKCFGTVNNAPFPADVPNAPATGTLLCVSIELDPVEAPVSPELVGLVSGNPPRLFNVTYGLKYFDPTATYGGSVNYHGHNLVPLVNKDGTGAAGWYLCTTDGDPGSPRLYPQSDHSNLFKVF